MVSQQGMLIKISELQPIATKVDACVSNLEPTCRIHDGAIVNGCLRSPSATRLSGYFYPRLNGFASLPHDRFAFIGAIIFQKSFALRTAGEHFALQRISHCFVKFSTGHFDWGN